MPDGTITTFDPAGSTGTFPTGIDDKGAAAGYYSDSNHVTRGFVRSATGKIKSFDPPDSRYTRPEGIAKASAVVGYFSDSGGEYHGFLRTR